jgi:hypothetical protein
MTHLITYAEEGNRLPLFKGSLRPTQTVRLRFNGQPITIWAVCLAGILLLGQGVSAQQLKKIALVIGNGSYTHVQKLSNPTNDSNLIAKTLTDLGFSLIGGGAQNNLSLPRFKKAVQDFSDQAATADVGIFYYAGHGVQVNGVNYLVPIDASIKNGLTDISTQMIDANSVLGALDKANIRLRFMILDACRNNPFASRSLLASSSGLADMSRGLTAMAAAKGTVIWYATQPGNVAEDGSGDDSPFTLAIAHNVIVPGRDIYAVFNHTGLEVNNVTNGRQQPWLAASYLEGDFYFIQAADGVNRSLFELPAVKVDPIDRIREVFSDGMKTPTRSFAFGQTYQNVNNELDSPFGIPSWESLPRAAEYGSTEVRYFWVPLTSLPVALSTLVPPSGMQGHCVDPESYIAFFFREQKLFHISIRFFKGETCSSYGWLINGLFSGEHRAALIHSPRGDTSVRAHDTPQYSIIEVTEEADSNVWVD